MGQNTSLNNCKASCFSFLAPRLNYLPWIFGTGADRYGDLRDKKEGVDNEDGVGKHMGPGGCCLRTKGPEEKMRRKGRLPNTNYEHFKPFQTRP